MAIGFQILNGDIIKPDKGLTIENTPKVRKAEFGDGYTQRTSYGINSLAQEFSVSFNNRTKAEIDSIVSFFEFQQGVGSFELTIPYAGDGTVGNESTTEKTIRVICSNWNQSLTYDLFYGLTATFNRVYESNAQQ